MIVLPFLQIYYIIYKLRNVFVNFATKRQRMILIADSGSTKTDWILANEADAIKALDTYKIITTQGINPIYQSEETIAKIVSEELLTAVNQQFAEPFAHNTFAKVAFYGAGCTEAMYPKMQKVLSSALQCEAIEVAGDLLGAARALCGNAEGVACILGTGANSCFYDGKQIVKNVPPLGYILGDEGSGAVLGKLFMNGIFKGSLPSEIRDAYLAEAQLTYQQVIENVYRKPLANRFLATTSKFILRHIAEPSLQQLVRTNFDNFFEQNIVHYHEYSTRYISAVGSIAHYFRRFFEASAATHGYEVQKIERSPIEQMLRYHLQNR